MTTIVKEQTGQTIENSPHNVTPQQTTDLSYVPSKYSKAFNSYSRSQIKFVLPFLASIARTCTLGPLYPVCKVMKAIAKIFMLNEIEVIFLAYLIKETNWDLRDKTIYANAENVQDIVCYSIDNPDYKRLILYLMVTSYTVKYYLNEKTADLMEEASKRCPNFKQIFQSWAKKHSDATTKINPRTLNSVYKRLYSNQRQEQPDFNMMVDAIIQISPAYNPEREKHGDKEKDKKKSKKELELASKKEQPMIKHEKSGFIPTAPLFSSSGILNMVALSQQQQLQHNGFANVLNPMSGLNPFMPFQSGEMNNDNYLRMIGSSLVGGLNQNYEIKDEDECGELVVGLQQGQSEQNLIYENKGNNNYLNQSQVRAIPVPRGQQTTQENNAFQTSFVCLARGNSISEKYLVKDNELQGSQFSVGSLMRKESEHLNEQENEAKKPKEEDALHQSSS